MLKEEYFYTPLVNYVRTFTYDSSQCKMKKNRKTIDQD